MSVAVLAGLGRSNNAPSAFARPNAHILGKLPRSMSVDELGLMARQQQQPHQPYPPHNVVIPAPRTSSRGVQHVDVSQQQHSYQHQQQHLQLSHTQQQASDEELLRSTFEDDDDVPRSGGRRLRRANSNNKLDRNVPKTPISPSSGGRTVPGSAAAAATAAVYAMSGHRKVGSGSEAPSMVPPPSSFSPKVHPKLQSLGNYLRRKASHEDTRTRSPAPSPLKTTVTALTSGNEFASTSSNSTLVSTSLSQSFTRRARPGPAIPRRSMSLYETPADLPRVLPVPMPVRSNTSSPLRASPVAAASSSTHPTTVRRVPSKTAGAYDVSTRGRSNSLQRDHDDDEEEDYGTEINPTPSPLRTTNRYATVYRPAPTVAFPSSEIKPSSSPSPSPSPSPDRRPPALELKPPASQHTKGSDSLSSRYVLPAIMVPTDLDMDDELDEEEGQVLIRPPPSAALPVTPSTPGMSVEYMPMSPSNWTEAPPFSPNQVLSPNAPSFDGIRSSLDYHDVITAYYERDGDESIMARSSFGFLPTPTSSAGEHEKAPQQQQKDYYGGVGLRVVEEDDDLDRRTTFESIMGAPATSPHMSIPPAPYVSLTPPETPPKPYFQFDRQSELPTPPLSGQFPPLPATPKLVRKNSSSPKAEEDGAVGPGAMPVSIFGRQAAKQQQQQQSLSQRRQEEEEEPLRLNMSSLPPVRPLAVPRSRAVTPITPETPYLPTPRTEAPLPPLPQEALYKEKEKEEPKRTESRFGLLRKQILFQRAARSFLPSLD